MFAWCTEINRKENMKREYNAAEGYSKSSVPGNWNRSTDFQFKDLTQVKYAPYDAVNNFFRRSVIVNLKFDTHVCGQSQQSTQ